MQLKKSIKLECIKKESKHQNALKKHKFFWKHHSNGVVTSCLPKL